MYAGLWLAYLVKIAIDSSQSAMDWIGEYRLTDKPRKMLCTKVGDDFQRSMWRGISASISCFFCLMISITLGGAKVELRCIANVCANLWRNELCFNSQMNNIS